MADRPIRITATLAVAAVAAVAAATTQCHPLARWRLVAGIAATIGANLAHGLGHGPPPVDHPA